jgi:hypothetical protein
LVLAVVMLVGSMGCELVALLLGKIADGEKPDSPDLVDGPAVVWRPTCCDVLVCSRCVLTRLDV